MAEESLKELMNRLWEVKTEITERNRIVKELNKSKMDYEQRLVAALRAIDLDQVRNDDATFSLSTKISPVPKDWDAIHKWVLDTGNLHIFMRRIMEKPYNELRELGEIIPGTEEIELTTIATKTRK